MYIYINYKFILHLLRVVLSGTLNYPCEVLLLWYCQFIIIMSSDVHKNPGPSSDHERGFNSGFSSFCNWNVNTLSKNNFKRVSLIEANNALFKYDIISLSETSLNDTQKVPDTILNGYSYHACNHPSGERKGVVGIFYKPSLPLKIKDDLSFQECIVTELRFGHKKIFFTVLYRNPFYKSDTPEFMNFITELELLVSKIKLEKPYVMLFAGDFNAHSKSWYADGDTNSDGIQLDTLFSDLGLSQLISEPTHTRENCNPTCIDLILTDQPNLIMETGC